MAQNLDADFKSQLLRKQQSFVQHASNHDCMLEALQDVRYALLVALVCQVVTDRPTC